MMNKSTNSLDMNNKEYTSWLGDIKQRIQTAQQRAVLAVNHELIVLYWQLGKEILHRQKQQGWGAKVVDQLSKDLKQSFPDMKGFSSRNLKYMRKFADSFPELPIVQQTVAQLPWSHICNILDKVKNTEEQLWYIHKAKENGWSRSVLIHQIESQLYKREGQAITNFDRNLPSATSEMAQQTLKDPYIFDFLTLEATAVERDLERELVRHVSQFLLELGAGFAFVGKQVPLNVAGDEFYLDLLFYHLKMRCYFVIELKTGDFKPEHTGQLSFYLSAVDDLIKSDEDKPTIGLLLCKNRNKVVAEYALRDNNKPIGVAEYQLAQALPENLKGKLPSIQEIEQELENK